MTHPTIDSFPAAVTYVSRTTGASEEDAEKVVRAVAAFAVAQYMADQASQPSAAPAPHGVTMEQVKAYVDGRLEGVIGRGPDHGSIRPCWVTSEEAITNLQNYFVAVRDAK